MLRRINQYGLLGFLSLSLIFGLSMIQSVAQTEAELGILGVPSDFSTIQAALDAAQPGDTVEVDAEAGPFEAVALLIDTPEVVLSSVNGRAVLVGVAGQTVVDVQASLVIVSGFELQGGLVGLRLVGNSNSIVYDNTFTEVGLLGILAVDAPRVFLNNNMIVAAQSSGIQLLRSDEAVVLGNSLRAARLTGIQVQESEGVAIEENLIERSETGIELRNVGFSEINNNNIRYNGTGILVDSATSISVENNTFYNNNTGISAQGESSELIVFRNNFEFNAFWAIFNQTESPILAQQNWWGRASGPGGVGLDTGDAISGEVDFSNWETEEIELNL